MKNKPLMKTLSAILAVVMFLCSAPLDGFAGLELPDWFGINASAATYSGSCGANVKWSLDTSTGVLNIIGTGEMKKYTYSLCAPWYNYRSYIKTINIQKGITSIGDCAFMDCYSLTSITIPESVTSIDYSAFSSCDNLTSIIIPEGVISIGDFAFRSCESLITIKIPDSVKSIGNFVFEDCVSLTTIVIPKGVASIGARVFLGCYNLTSITVDSDNENYSSDEYGVLYNKNKTNLIRYPVGNSRTTFKIFDGVISIDEYAFIDCYNLTTIIVPESVTSIDGDAFYDCYSLTTIMVDLDNKNYSNDEYGVLYNKNKTTLIQYPTGNSRETFTIPKSVTGIFEYAFYHCQSLTRITIPDGITSIRHHTFSGCENLTTITIPKSVIGIFEHAFYDCNSLTDIYYTGTEDEWRQISIKNYNEPLTNATVHYNSIPVGKILLSLTDSDGNVVKQKLVDNSLTQYAFTDVADGEYKVTVSGINHVTRNYDVVALGGKVTFEFSLNKIGDIDGNGKVTVTDYTLVLRHVKKTSVLEDYEFACADVNGDGKINVTDYSAILRHVKKTSSLW